MTVAFSTASFFFSFYSGHYEIKRSKSSHSKLTPPIGQVSCLPLHSTTLPPHTLHRSSSPGTLSRNRPVKPQVHSTTTRGRCHPSTTLKSITKTIPIFTHSSANTTLLGGL
ncbi:hypothetical protein E2C01_057760 [Portunus trituberculatus]|uniref:Uncharacterized protein n=1 Tax=Portunus trituberculatus TaxID=210409 RepID=A0A5B7H187_PORTR|nr:hypothetical protein [Portunus trituberculatus]